MSPMIHAPSAKIRTRHGASCAIRRRRRLIRGPVAHLRFAISLLTGKANSQQTTNNDNCTTYNYMQPTQYPISSAASIQLGVGRLTDKNNSGELIFIISRMSRPAASLDQTTTSAQLGSESTIRVQVDQVACNRLVCRYIIHKFDPR